MQLSLYILKLSIFSSQLFVIPVPVHYFTICFKFYFPLADIIINHLYMLFLRSLKTNTKSYNKKPKKSVARNIVASKKILFSEICQTRFSRSRKLSSNVNLAEYVIMTSRQNVV